MQLWCHNACSYILAGAKGRLIRSRLQLETRHKYYIGTNTSVWALICADSFIFGTRFEAGMELIRLTRLTDTESWDIFKRLGFGLGRDTITCKIMMWGNFTINKSKGFNYWMLLVFLTKLCLYITYLFPLMKHCPVSNCSFFMSHKMQMQIQSILLQSLMKKQNIFSEIVKGSFINYFILETGEFSNIHMWWNKS